MPIEEMLGRPRGGYQDLEVAAKPLRERVFRTPPTRREQWIAELVERFDAFAVYTRQRMAQEEDGGYLTPLLEARPSLSAAIEVLRHEHMELRRILDDLQVAVQRLPPNARLLLSDRCKRIEDLFHWLERHEEHENYILQCALAENGPTQGG